MTNITVPQSFHRGRDCEDAASILISCTCYNYLFVLEMEKRGTVKGGAILTNEVEESASSCGALLADSVRATCVV